MSSSAVGGARNLLAPSVVTPAGDGLGWFFVRRFGLPNVPESGGNHRNFNLQRFACTVGVRYARGQKRGKALIEPRRVNCAFLEIGVGENFFKEDSIGADSGDLQF